MEVLPVVTRFHDATTRASHLDALRSGDVADPLTRFTVAWHLRQTNTQDCVDLAKTFLQSDVMRSPPDAATLYVKAYLQLVLAESYWLNGLLEESSQSTELAVSLFVACGSESGLSDARWLESSIASERAQYAERRRLMAVSLDHAVAALDEERTVSCRLALSFFCALEQEDSSVDEQIPYATSHLNHSSIGVRSLAHSFLAHVSFTRSKFLDGLDHLKSSVAFALEAGQVRRAILDSTNIGYVLADLGELEACVDQAHDALALARRTGWKPQIGACLTVVAHALLKAERADAARALAEEALDCIESHAQGRPYLIALNTAADAYAACGDFLKARTAFQDMLVHTVGRSESSELERYARLGLARAQTQLGHPADARSMCHEALTLARQAGDVVVEVECLRLLAKLTQGDQPSETINLLRQAEQVIDRSDDYPAPSSLLHDLSAVLERNGDHQNALLVLRKAVAARARETAAEASRKAVSMEVRFRTERAMADAEHQRRTAETESRRAAELEALNRQLQEAMSALTDTQALLLKRNEELNTAYARISDLSLTDPLTGLRNRRFLSQVMDSAVAQCLRANRPSVFGELDPLTAPNRHDIVFFLLDLDHFKLVNDQHGHAAGDAVLVQLKDRLRTVTREQDFLVRWGGEEFLIAAPGIDRRDGPLIAERLRLAVASSPFLLPDGSKLTKTVSIGVAAYPLNPTCPEAGSWEAVVEIADARLYAAKRKGRDGWVCESLASSDATGSSASSSTSRT